MKFVPTSLVRSVRLIATACLGTLLLQSSAAYSWGSAGHSLVNQGAADMSQSVLGPFFRANTNNLARLANVPDQLWKRDATREQEKSTHFFQWDQYARSALDRHMPLLMQDALRVVERDFVVENGSAVWRVDQLYTILVQALRSRNWPRALQIAGVLGHYVGDLAQPMHDTSDYDGQSIGKRGIHAYYEATLVGRQDRPRLYNDVMTDAAGRAGFRDPDLGDLSVVRLAFNEGKAGLDDLPVVLEHFASRDQPNDQGLGSLMISHMADAVVTLKTIWDKAAHDADLTVDSGVPTGAITVGDPAWVALDF